jgi:hypothetical protein
VKQGKPGRCDAVFGSDIQMPEAAVTYALREIVRLELADRLSDRYFLIATSQIVAALT